MMHVTQRLACICLVTFYVALAMLLSYGQGQDLNWDLLNYHFYNAYMLVDGRFVSDVHAAGVQTFLNPLADLPFYAAVRLGIPPIAFFLTLSATHGLALFLVHKIAELIVAPASPVVSLAAGVIAATTAAFGAGFQSELGTTLHDNTLAVPLLGAVWLVLREASQPSSSLRPIALAGGLAGAAAGMKLALAPLCIGLTLSVVALPGAPRLRITRSALFCGLVGVGVLLTAGYWMVLMQHHFSSPLFPFYNAIFQSPFAPLTNFADARFLPETVKEAIFYPYYWLSRQRTVTEAPFRDGRIATAMLWLSSMATYLVLALPRFKEMTPLTNLRPLTALVLFWGGSYVVWLGMFSIYRYAIALEMLSVVIVLGVAARLSGGGLRMLSLVLPFSVLLNLLAAPPDWGRIPWSESYFGVDTASLERYRGATILMWDLPNGHLAPFFPREARFVRIGGYFVTERQGFGGRASGADRPAEDEGRVAAESTWGLSHDTAMWARVVEAASTATPGALFLLDRDPGVEHDQQEKILAQLGLKRTGACEYYASHAKGFRICALSRR